ncbi:hypothetical protein [Novosphingobium jiangmenense]|nr:hypothetical protein [Novosphingobium jiangmenense]
MPSNAHAKPIYAASCVGYDYAFERLSGIGRQILSSELGRQCDRANA